MNIKMDSIYVMIITQFQETTEFYSMLLTINSIMNYFSVHIYILKHEDGKKYFYSFSFIIWSLFGFLLSFFFPYQYNTVLKITNSGG